jgi:UrcA family protein
MFGRISSLLLSGCAAAGAAAIGLSFATAASAQPYDEQPAPYADQPAPYDEQPAPAPYAGGDYAADTSATVGEIVVTPGYRPDRDENGIPTERVYASRVVAIDDLDLSTDWGVDELHNRVAHAASDACEQLDNQWPQGLNPIDSNDGDCKARAIRHAMAEAPITDPNYDGYGY